MTTKALFVRLEAKAGKEDEVAKFLRDGQGLVAQEPATAAWFGIRLGPTTFAIFDAFSDEAGRDAHLSGKVAKALMEKRQGFPGAYRSITPSLFRLNSSASFTLFLRLLMTNVLFSPRVDHGPRGTSLNSTKRQSVTSVSFNLR